MVACSFDMQFAVNIACIIYLTLYIRHSSALLQHEDTLDDILTPYKSYLEHLDVKRNHRHVRECQPILYGNTTFETFSAKNNEPDTEGINFRTFVNRNGGNYVYGHIVRVSNAFERLSVLQPLGGKGCSKNERATVALSSKQMNCRVAVNAGYFNTHTGSCLGNVVSNGRLIRDARGIQNANFGILKNGSLVTGYLSEREVTPGRNKTDFYQLVTGVFWLLRDGSVYINESMKAECQDTEETGTLYKFANVLSARTAIGHDENGNVIIVQVDGKTHHSGLNLYDFTQLLQSFGLFNAINLDGGGSATFVVNQTVVNYPSDQCKDYLCARSVSTILCVHDKNCHTTGCHGNGKCGVDGQCVCEKPWTGPTCSDQEHPVNSSLCSVSGQLKNKPVNNNTLLSLDKVSCPDRNCTRQNATTKALIKRFLQNNYAWLDALLGVSLIVNLILLAVVFCCGSNKVQGRKSNLELKEDQQRLLTNNIYEDEL